LALKPYQATSENPHSLAALLLEGSLRGAMPLQYTYKPYFTPTPTIKGDRLIGAALLRQEGIESKVIQENLSRSPGKLHRRVVEHRTESLLEVLKVQLRQFTITAASTRQLQVWIMQEIEGAAYSLELQKGQEQYLTGVMLAEMEELLADANPVWPLVRTSQEIEGLHQHRASLGIVELLQRAYEVYASVVIGERLRRRPFRGIWRTEIPLLVSDDCIRLGWKDPSWQVDRRAKRTAFGPNSVTEDFKTRFLAALAEPIERWSKRMEGIAVDDREPISEGEDQWPLAAPLKTDGRLQTEAFKGNTHAILSLNNKGEGSIAKGAMAAAESEPEPLTVRLKKAWTFLKQSSQYHGVEAELIKGRLAFADLPRHIPFEPMFVDMFDMEAGGRISLITDLRLYDAYRVVVEFELYPCYHEKLFQHFPPEQRELYNRSYDHGPSSDPMPPGVLAPDLSKQREDLKTRLRLRMHHWLMEAEMRAAEIEQHLENEAKLEAFSAKSGDAPNNREASALRAKRRQAVVTPILQQKDWTRGRLVTEAGIGKNSVYRYLDGTRRKITAENRKAIAQSLGITEEQLPD
jgi:hypothetical protein